MNIREIGPDASRHEWQNERRHALTHRGAQNDTLTEGKAIRHLQPFTLQRHGEHDTVPWQPVGSPNWRDMDVVVLTPQVPPAHVRPPQERPLFD